MDGKTGQPVEGVTVTLLQRAPSAEFRERSVTTVISDQRGAFTLRAPSAGEYTISAYRPPAWFGEFNRDPFSESPTRWFSVPQPNKIVVRLWTLSRIAGVVTDDTGEPLKGIVVRALYKTVLGGRAVLKTVPQTATTDNDGKYALAQLPPRPYVFLAAPPVVLTPLALRSQYYDRAFQPSGATVVRLNLSQALERVDFQLRRQRGYRVSGVIGGVSDSVRVELYDAPGGELPSDVPAAVATTTPEGRFEMIGVAAGSYELRFVRYPQRQSKTSGNIRFMEAPGLAVPRPLALPPEEPTWWSVEPVYLVDRDVSVTVQPRQGARVGGRIEFSGQTMPTTEALQSQGIYVRSVDHRFFGTAQLGPAREDRTFKTTALPFGRYVLGMLSPYPGFQLESVRIGGREVTGASFELDRDITDAVLTFAARTTAIAGRIQGAPNSDRFVLIWPEDRALWSGAGTGLGCIYRAVTSDGPYYLRVSPGAYRIVAMAGLPPDDWESAEYLASLISVSQRVTAVAGQVVNYNPIIVTRR